MLAVTALERHRKRSSSLPPEKARLHRKGLSRSLRSSSVEGRDVRRAKELEAAAAAAGAGGHPGAPPPLSPRAQIESLHRRVGRCILLLARFVTRSKEEENGTATGDDEQGCRGVFVGTTTPRPSPPASIFFQGRCVGMGNWIFKVQYKTVLYCNFRLRSY